MHKITIILFLTSFSLFAQKKSQEQRQYELDRKRGLVAEVKQDSVIANYPVKFCLIVATGKLFSNKVDISIDYGQDSSFFEDTAIRNQEGKRLSFNSPIDALNYMASLGWEFVNAYAITTGNQNVYHYLLKAGENLKDDYIPKTKRDFKKNNK